MDFVTIKDVELISVGMDWPSASGPITFRFEHLNDAMVAANEDPHIVPPRLKIGHSDPRFADPDDPGHDPFYDGEPAFGSVHNLRLINDGATLIGDYVLVPAWLGEVLPSAYPNRSIEGAYEALEGPLGEPLGSWEVDTPGGKHYSFVLTACALLGLCRPAVQDLEDLRALLTEGDGVIVTGDPEAEGEPVAASGGSVSAGSMGDVKRPASATADIDKVIDVFCQDFCEGERYWWWPRSLWVDPNVVIADDDEGSLWSIPITTGPTQDVEFGEPSRVLQTFVDAPAQAVAMAAGDPRMVSAATDARPAVRFTTRGQTPLASRKKGGAQGGVTPPGRTFGMDFKALRASLSVGDEVTDEQIAAALTEQGLEVDDDDTGAGDGSGDGEGEGDGEGADAGEGDGEGEGDGSGEGAGDGNPPAASASSPSIPVDRKVLDKLQADAAQGVAARKQQRDTERAADLSAAIKSGKIMPSSREAWDTKYRANPEATKAELDALPEGLVPVEEDGSSRSEADAAGAVDMAALFGPEYANTREAA